MMAATTRPPADKRREFAKDFDDVTRRLRRHDPLSVIEKCIEVLHNPAISDPRRWPEGFVRSYPPWNPLLLIKWTFQSGRFTARRPRITDDQFVQLFNHVGGLNRFQDPREFDSIRLFMKNMAFQQFWFQERVHQIKFARPEYLFSTLPRSRTFNERFLRAVGMDLEEFFDLSFALVCGFVPPKVNVQITKEFFRPVFGVYGEAKIQAFLDYLALSVRDARRFARVHSGIIKNPILALYEQTPFKQHPFLKINDAYVCYAPVVLHERLIHFVYDVLRATDPDWFGREFGPVFEEYVDRAMTQVNREIYRERELRTITRSDRKMVDFVIPYDLATILVEAKGIELTPLARLSPRVDVVARSLKSTAIKAITQALSTARALADLRDTGNPITPNGPCYALVVTYKRLYLGTANDIIGLLDEEERAQLLRDVRGDLGLLPLDHIYFVSIEDLEHAIAIERAGIATVAEVVAQSVAEDANPPTSMFELGQRLDRVDRGATLPDFLTQQFNEMTERVKRRFETGRL